MTFEKSISFHLVAGGGRGRGVFFLLLLEEGFKGVLVRHSEKQQKHQEGEGLITAPSLLAVPFTLCFHAFCLKNGMRFLHLYLLL